MLLSAKVSDSELIYVNSYLFLAGIRIENISTLLHKQCLGQKPLSDKEPFHMSENLMKMWKFLSTLSIEIHRFYLF